RKGREKHGGDRQRVDLDTVAVPAPEPKEDLVALDSALTRLASEDPEAARLVELRHFAGLTVPEAAQVLGISSRTADRLWSFASAWPQRELTTGKTDPES